MKLFLRKPAALAPPHTNDFELAQRVLQKDRSAFEEFFAEYYQRLFRFCLRRVSDRALAEDLTQETLIKALAGMHGYRGEAALFTWLCQICRNEVSDWMRRNSKRMAITASLDERPEIIAQIDEAQRRASADLGELTASQQLIHVSLDSLPASYGDVLEMKYLEGLSVTEIAEHLGGTHASAQSLLARARDAFRRSYMSLSNELTPVQGSKPEGLT